MNYIGSKHKLASLIKQTVTNVVGNDLSNKVFCDLFAGTGIVGRNFKQEVKQVISNDIEYYSYVLNKNYIENHLPIDTKDIFIQLNELEGETGFIYENYCRNANSERQYFTPTNGKKIDAIRQKIERLSQNKQINSAVYFHLLASLLESADRVANTASVYGAYLKKVKKTAEKEFVLQPAEFLLSEQKHQVFNEDSNVLIQKIEGNILYLDPPYNARQYGANYHLLNTIALYDEFEPRGKTGLREYHKSKYCRKSLVAQEFEDLIKNANFNYLFLSYNNEGLMSFDTIREIMTKYGYYDFVSTNYQRFKADKTESRNHKADKTEEFLHILEK